MTTLISGLILLGVLIVAHEFGHFIVAKLFGVRVLTFSIGFGPKLVGFTRGETEYRISAIPLGGYVRMYGDQLTEDVPDDQKRFSFFHQPIWKKSLIAFAGPFFNFLLPIVLFFFVFVGTQKVPLPVVGAVLTQSPASRAGLKAGDKITKINGQPVDDFSEVVSRISENPGKPLVFSVERAGSSNIQLTVVPSEESGLDPLEPQRKVGRIGILPVLEKTQIAVVAPNSAAAKAGLRTFDTIETVNGNAVADASALLAALTQDTAKAKGVAYRRVGEKELRTAQLVGNKDSATGAELPLKRFAVNQSELADAKVAQQIAQTRIVITEEKQLLARSYGIAFVGNTVEALTPDSPASSLGIAPGDRIIGVDGRLTNSSIEVSSALQTDPAAIHVIALQTPKGFQLAVTRLKSNIGDKKGISLVEGDPGKRLLGVTFASAYAQGPTKSIYVGPIKALGEACERTWELLVMTVKSLGMLLSFKVPASQIGGPIMIFGVAGQAAQQGFEFYAFVMAMISVNLGLLNLLPIPVLDGGHLLLLGIEAVQRRPLSIKTRQVATKIGFMLLLSLMALAVFNDVTRMFS